MPARGVSACTLQVQRLIAILSVPGVSRRKLLEDSSLDPGPHLTKEEHKQLEAAGWKPGTTVRSLLNFTGTHTWLHPDNLCELYCQSRHVFCSSFEHFTALLPAMHITHMFLQGTEFSTRVQSL